MAHCQYLYPHLFGWRQLVNFALVTSGDVLKIINYRIKITQGLTEYLISRKRRNFPKESNSCVELALAVLNTHRNLEKVSRFELLDRCIVLFSVTEELFDSLKHS